MAVSASAQDALRYSLAGEQAARAQTQSLAAHPYNLRLGNARFLADASLNIEGNDNVWLREKNTEADLILRPQVTTRVFWPVSEKNAFNFSIGLGYAKYLKFSENDYFMVTPGSELSFDLFVKDFRFTFFDRLSYTQDPLQNGAVSGVARFGGLDNSIGVNGLWDLNKAIVSAGYAHQNFIPDQPAFDYLTRSAELFHARAAFGLYPTLTAGPEASSGITTYDQSGRGHEGLHDSVSYSAGGFTEFRLTSHMTANAHGGFVIYQFDTPSASQSADSHTNPYYSLGVDHTLNEFISHSLMAGFETTTGTYSDIQERYYARYNIGWRILRDVGLGTGLFYEHGSYSATVAPVNTTIPGFSASGETYNRVGATINLSYRLMEKLNATAGYRLTLKNSDTPGFDYTQNAVTLGLTYQF